MKLFYVYSIRSLKDPTKYYVGITDNVDSRVEDHNDGKSKHTLRYRPWILEFYVSFANQEKALSFEKYLKSGSGRAFVKKHF